MKHTKIETRSAVPLETRNDPDPIEAATLAVAEMRTAFDARMAGIDELTARIDEIETRSQRPNSENNDEIAPERRAFTNYLRLGREGMIADEVRSLIVGDDTKGGYLAPAEFVAEVIKGIVEFSPVRQAARVGNTSSGSVILPKRTGRPTASWVGETETRTETQSAYGQAEIPVHEMACYVDVSQRLIEDSAVNIESEVAMDLAEEFGRLEGVALVNGDGIKKPVGFMQNADVAYTANGHATVLAADPLISLLYAMPAHYRNTGSWMCNGSTLATIRKLKDGQNNYLWSPSYQAGQPETLLGRPVIEAVDMPDIASGAYPIVFGDFNRAYRVYDRVGFSIMRDPYTQAASGLVRFHSRRRLGAGTVLADALRKLKMATS